MFRAVLVALVLALASPAHAKGQKRDATIEMCGLASFDAVFARVAAIDQRLTAAKRDLGESKRALDAALGLDKSASLQEALGVLKTRARGQLRVTTSGGLPRVEAKGSVPPDVAAGIEAVNGMVGAIGRSIADVEGLPAEAAAIVTEAKKLPKRLKGEAKSAGLKPLAIPKVLRVVKQDVQVAAALPAKATALAERMATLLAAVAALGA